MHEPPTLRWREGWQALRPFVRTLSGAGWWLLGGLALTVAALVGSLGLLGLSGAFLTGAAIAGLSPVTAATFNFFMPGAGVRFLAVLRTTARWGERVLSHEGTFRLLAGLRVSLYDHLARLAPSQLRRYHGGDLLNRLMRDIDALDNLYPRVLMPMAAASLVMALLVAVFIWQAPGLVHVPLMLWACAVVGLPWLGWLLGRSMAPSWMRLRTTLRVRLLDTVEGLEDLSLHPRAWTQQRQRTLDSSAQWLRLHSQVQRRSALLRTGVGLLVGLAAWWSLAWLGGHAVGVQLGVPWIVALVLLLMGCAEALQPLAGACVDLPGTASAAQRLNAITNEPPHTLFVGHGAQPAHSGIDVHDLHFKWDEHTPVLAGLNLHIRPGEHLLLTGDSGCGKSTLLALITRMEQPEHGQILLGDVPIDMLDEPTLRQQVACALQDTWVQTATLADNLRLARPDATEAEMLDVLRLVGLDPAASGWRQGLNTWIDEGGANLSGGQRRRLSVARALLQAAPITLLDEPSEGLDLAGEAELTQHVTRHLQGRTLIWVSHRTTATEAFSRVLNLQAVS
ncbi:thiol reductant ABC exporter subunit CydC [Aquabacterium sp. A3]|uniref:thiol reductant ABC exporter subunit CydC n=1 Tax=Aquabacterium sp. A3 TaxID=3132829 RepID=UPI003119AEA4